MKKDKINLYTIDIEEWVIDDLYYRLENVRYPDEDSAILAEKDITLSKMKSWVEYWKNQYNMRSIEEKFNQHDLYETVIEDTTIVFNHIPSENDGAPALLLLDGWPDSALSYFGMIDFLKKDFELIIPTLPGFGAPGPVKGINAEKVSELLQQMMINLGFGSYYVHGIDFGSAIARILAVSYPKSVEGIHITMLFHANAYDESQIDVDNSYEQSSLATSQHYEYNLSGYAAIQSTKPQDISYAMSDSPVGLLAWIGSQFLAWSPEQLAITTEQLIDVVMVYWIYNTLGSSARYYKLGGDSWGGEVIANIVPTSLTVMPNDVGLPIKRLAQEKDNIVDWSLADRGGHFAAYDAPEFISSKIIELKNYITKNKFLNS